MRRKGMLEWKILAAIFAVLIVVSSALVSNTGIKDFFMNTTGDFEDSTSGSPLDWLTSFFSTPEKGTNPVMIKLMTGNMSLDIGTPVNITAGTAGIANFKGAVELDFRKNSTIFMPSGSEIRLDMGLEGTEIRNVRITKLILRGIDFVVTSEKTNITASDDDIEIYDFLGDIIITDYVLLKGNVSKVKDDQWSIG
jgi:hypothetical protein